MRTLTLRLMWRMAGVMEVALQLNTVCLDDGFVVKHHKTYAILRIVPYYITAEAAALSGLGYGLPLSRIYAR